MATGDLYRTAVEYQSDGQLNVNVYYMKQTKVTTGGAKQAAEDMAPIFAGLYGLILAPGSRAANIIVRCQLVSRLFSDGGEKLQPLSGSPGGGAALPPTNAIVIRLKTGFADRTRRGRVFLGCVPGGVVTAGVLNQFGQDNYGGFAANLVTNFGGNAPAVGFSLGVFSRERYSLISNPFDEYWKPVTVAQAIAQVATMRSRKVGVGQ